jgi:hypothetical protein
VTAVAVSINWGCKPCLRNVNFVILRYSFLNNYKLYTAEIWHTNIYEFSVPTDIFFHSNMLINRFIMQYLWFSLRWLWRVLSPGIQRCVVRWKSTDVSEEYIASIFRFEWAEQDKSVKAGDKKGFYISKHLPWKCLKLMPLLSSWTSELWDQLSSYSH